VTQPGIEDRATHARRGLHDKLEELERRAVATKQALDPGHLFESPWVRFGMAVMVGFAVGHGRESTVLRTGVRILLTAGVKHLLQDALQRPDARPASTSASA
jgi:hypothetical protein